MQGGGSIGSTGSNLQGQEPSSKQSKQILIIGRTGNGKRSIGNSILGKQVFQPGEDYKQYLKAISGEHNNVTVVICPFVGDNVEDNQCSFQSIQSAAKQMMFDYSKSGGFDVIVFVLKYGVRFTDQELKSVQIAEDILESHLFDSHVILAFSHGDLFQLDQDKNDLSIEQWCSKQEGSISLLFSKVCNRILIFDNKSTEHTYDENKFYDMVYSKQRDDTATRDQSIVSIPTLENTYLTGDPILKKYTLKEFEEHHGTCFLC